MELEVICSRTARRFRRFAHRMIDDAGVDLLHGHSSHTGSAALLQPTSTSLGLDYARCAHYIDATPLIHDSVTCGWHDRVVTRIPHTSQEFERELNLLGERLVTMGERAEHQLIRAITAVIDRDDAIANEVIAGDAAINTAENEIDGDALQLLARYQPVAADLRFIAMCLKAVIDIERIGDLAVDTARRAHELNRIRVPAWHFDLGSLETSVTRALHAVLASLRGKDAERAEQVLRETLQIEQVYARLLAELLAHIATNPSTITWVLPLTSVCRYLGRIGDYVRNLAGQVIYMVRAEHVRYVGA